jgi:hypothetical protein
VTAIRFVVGLTSVTVISNGVSVAVVIGSSGDRPTRAG